MIHIQNLVGGYSKTPIIKGIDLEINKSEFFALLGPNGSGKTTIFKLITGQLPIISGSISIAGKEISSFSKLEKAKKIAVLTQEVQVSFDYTVEEIVSLGRYPHQKGILKNLSKHDLEVIEEVMEITKVSEFRKKQFRTISGGEKQRVLLAKALAQEPEILLLDEPTNHLDIKHTFQILDLLKTHQHVKGLTIFSILHDLNVASLYADRFALLNNGSLLEVGDVNLLRNEEQLQHVYQVQVNAQSHPTVPKPQLLMTPKFVEEAKSPSFVNGYEIKQQHDFVHVHFEQPLRTISNGIVGDGIQWLQHFCQVHAAYNPSNEELLQWFEQKDLPSKQTSVMMTTQRLENIVVVERQVEGIQMMIMAMSEVGMKGAKGKVNMMLFMDAHFSDGALVNGYMIATEAKMKALQELNIATSSDSLLLGLTQNGEVQSSASLENRVGKAIHDMVYSATKEAVQKNLQLV
ncbi:ABC transporter ATP-binding protein [Lysinibacillus antri]|uniref:ATP-binding cassette domain-containing protein n=1 Tax=Lysinibacillus antri TaxID=2498145 RepID=A0A432L9S5_9BACI|nr:ATP-binding cassette domain-containing protein [Lysinibacillus antri]RUL50804.1 ATP-binding cassette domain-containing protein [Lysinibacillus antri]